MNRTRKGGRPPKAALALERARRKPVERRVKTRIGRDHPKVRRLTARFLSLEENFRRDTVETFREMGAVLEEGEKILDEQYFDWVEEDLGVSLNAARNYRAVLEVSRTNPDLFIEWKSIGASRLMRLARVRRDAREKVLLAAYGPRRDREVSDAEFKEIARPYMENPRVVTGNMKAHGLRMKVQSMARSLREAKRLPKIEKDEIRLGLCRDLSELLRAVRELKSRIC